MPKDSTGAELPLPTFGAAFYSAYSEYVEGTSNPLTLVNLNTSFRAYDTTTRQYATVADPAQPAYYYVYTTATGVEPEFLNFAGAPCTVAWMLRHHPGVTCRHLDRTGFLAQRSATTELCHLVFLLPHADQHDQKRGESVVYAADR